MIHSTSVARLGSEFDAFLFAPVGDDCNGMPLSVLSALARADVDPWQEAASLARLPGAMATERLSLLIAALPDEPSALREPESVAARLITLLPHATAVGSSGDASPGVGTALNSMAVIRVVAINVLVVAFLLGTQWLAMSHQLPAPPAQAVAAAPPSGPAKPLTPNPGQ